MATYSYTNETENDLVLVGIGIVKSGATIETDEPLENPNLTPVDPKAKKKPVNEEPGDVS